MKPTRILSLLMLILVCASLSAAVAFPGARSLEADAVGDEPDSYAGIARPSAVLSLAFAVRGKVHSLAVEPGQRVEAGQLLVSLDDAVQRHMVELARNRAEDDTQIRSAEKTFELREAEYRDIIEAYQRDSASESDVRTRRLQRDLAEINVEAEHRRAAEAALTLAREEARLAEMHLLSPIEGVVAEIHKRPGETVDELTTVVTLVAPDPLWFEVNLPTEIARRLSIGDEAAVKWQDIADAPEVTGRVIYKSPISNPGARRILVRVELPNRNDLPGGLHGDVRFRFGQQARTSADTGR